MLLVFADLVHAAREGFAQRNATRGAGPDFARVSSGHRGECLLRFVLLTSALLLGGECRQLFVFLSVIFLLTIHLSALGIALHIRLGELNSTF